MKRAFFLFAILIIFDSKASNRHLLSSKSMDSDDILKVEIRNEKLHRKESDRKRKSERDIKELLRVRPESPKKN